MSPNYTQTIDLLHRINAITIEGKPISSYFVHEGSDMWGTYQMSIFADIKRYTMNPTAYKQDKKNRASFLRILLLIESLIALVFSKPDVVVYTIDKISSKTAQNDIRIDPLYEVLIKNKINYLEIVHAVSGPITFGNFLTRRRPVVYLEAFVFGSKKFDLKLDLKDFEGKDFVEYLIKKYHHRFYTHQNINNIFRFIQPKALWGIDDVRHTGELLIETKKRNIPSYLFQHGHFTKYHVGWLTYTEQCANIPQADYLVVWNEYWKKELIRLGTYYPSASIIVGGEKSFKEIKSKISTELSVLIPYETDAPKQEIKKYIVQFKKENIKVYLKVRNDISHAKQIEEYGGDLEIATDIIPVTAVVGVYSTLLYDVLGILPVGILKTSMDYGYGMVENKMAGLISGDNLKQQISALPLAKIDPHSALLSDTVYSIAHTCGILSKK